MSGKMEPEIAASVAIFIEASSPLTHVLIQIIFHDNMPEVEFRRIDGP